MSTENMKIDISKLPTDDTCISKIVNNYYKKSVEDQLKIFKNQTTDSKLNTFANCYNEFSRQSYLDLNLSKSIVKNLTKLRISVHTLLIEMRISVHTLLIEMRISVHTLLIEMRISVHTLLIEMRISVHTLLIEMR